jgi:hypothetical protein
VQHGTIMCYFKLACWPISVTVLTNSNQSADKYPSKCWRISVNVLTSINQSADKYQMNICFDCDSSMLICDSSMLWLWLVDALTVICRCLDCDSSMLCVSFLSTLADICQQFELKEYSVRVFWVPGSWTQSPNACQTQPERKRNADGGYQPTRLTKRTGIQPNLSMPWLWFVDALSELPEHFGWYLSAVCNVFVALCLILVSTLAALWLVSICQYWQVSVSLK